MGDATRHVHPLAGSKQRDMTADHQAESPGNHGIDLIDAVFVIGNTVPGG